MTAAEMKEQFLVQYDAATSFAAPGWEDDEISNFINKAIKDVIDELYLKGDLIHLSNLIKTSVGVAIQTLSDISNAVVADLTPFNYMYYISAKLKLTRTDPVITDTYIPAEKIDVTTAPKFFKTGINKVWFKYPKCYLDYSTQRTYPDLVFLFDSYTTPTLAGFTYIEFPTNVDITNNIATNINQVLHKDIVTKAVEEAVKAVKIAKLTNQG